MYWYRHLLPPISLYCTVQYNINTLCQYTVSGILPYEWLLCVVLVELSCVIHGWRGKWMWVIILCSSHNVWFIHHLLCVGFKSVYVVFKYHVTFVSIFQQFPGCVGQFVEHRILDPKAMYQFKSGHVHLLYFAHENNDYSIHFCIFALWTFALTAWHLGDPDIDPPVYVSIIMATVLVWNDIARILVCTDSRSWSWYWSYVLLSFQEDGGECFVNVVEFSFVPSHCLAWLSHLSVSLHSFLYSPWLLMLRLSVAAITHLWTSRWSFAYSICTPHGRDMRAVAMKCRSVSNPTRRGRWLLKKIVF